jgi:hypothetical protein
MPLSLPLVGLLACVASPSPAPSDPGWDIEQAGSPPRARHTRGPLSTAPRLPFAEGEDPDEDPALSAPLWAEGSIHDLRLTIDPAQIAALEEDPDADVPATLAYGDAVWPEVGVHLKGNMTLRTFAGKPSLKIDVHQWHPWQRFFGLRRLTLNNMLQDKSMVKEHVAYHLYALLGVPAPRHGYVRLTVNDQPYGVYGLVETMDGVFVDREWPGDDEGNLYEGGYGADLYAWHTPFEVQRTGVPTPPEDLDALVDALEASDPDTLLGVLDARFDLDALLTTLAVDLLAGNWDGYARAANNFLLYHAPEADEWHLLPWGQDQAFTDVNVPIDAGWEGRLLVLCGRAPACRARLYDRVGDVLTAWVQSDLHGYAADTVATLAPDCEADPRAEIPCLPEDVLGFLADRPGKVAAELAVAR